MKKLLLVLSVFGMLTTTSVFAQSETKAEKKKLEKKKML